ncbi:hypothetical protein [Rhodococcus sp. IEGM 1379]|uniref:hypothetical protein n=1 Tax=Rhodococcus sp. IEGM 1379 TaxID=3047086 RepID=UPI0024B68210|nr:hypothetical protein [Rhodococcus sp. IEGM 1379]
MRIAKSDGACQVLKENAIALRVDKKSQIQALDRVASTFPSWLTSTTITPHA